MAETVIKFSYFIQFLGGEELFSMTKGGGGGGSFFLFLANVLAQVAFHQAKGHVTPC